MKTPNIPNETLFSSILNLMSNAAVISDSGGAIVGFNRHAEYLFGYNNGDVVGNPVSMLLPESLSSQSSNSQAIEMSLRKDDDRPMHESEIILKHKNGSSFAVDANISRLPADDADYLAYILRPKPSRDCDGTPLSISETRYRRLFETAKDGILILDAETGAIDDVNPFLIGMLGYPYDQFIGKAIWEIGLFKDIAANRSKFIELQQNEYVRYENLPLESADGKKLNVEFISNVYLEGRKKVIQCNIRDISQRKKTEADLIASKEKAEENDRLKTAFLQNMSHEIRTPLNGIIGFSGFLTETGISKSDVKEFAEIIIKSATRLNEIVSNVLDISKIQTGQLTTEIVPVAINSMFSNILSFFSYTANEKNISLNYYAEADSSLTIMTDELRLHQVLTNLVSNAIKFTQSGYIDYGCKIIGNDIRFYVRDTGSGILPKQTNSIFDRFTQGSQDISRLYDGTGLGLAISKGIVQLLGGDIWVESELGVGSTFFFTLPLVTADLTSDEPSQEVLNSLIGRKGTILIVEDDWAGYRYLYKLLCNSEITMIHAANGLQSVELVKNNPEIDLILMDIRMPLMNGIEATKLIKLQRPDLPIIAQTAYAFTEERAEILGVGCDEFLSKPINKSQLFALINKYIPSKKVLQI